MNTDRILISLTPELKTYLGELKEEGYTAAGYIRGLLEKDRQDWREYQASQSQKGKRRIRHSR
ncbi:MAG TPA: hypothetical protein PKK23_02615 [Nitrospirales bacterium]|nr:hypothetical protein [Nitrospiraceae bacterium]HNP27910.1 hypothetical protein [Nitrospirales bacterium]